MNARTDGEADKLDAIERAPGAEASDSGGMEVFHDDSRLKDSHLRHVFFWAAVAVSLFHLWANIFATLSTLWLAGVHFAGLAFLCALRFPLWPGKGARTLGIVFDVIFAIAVAVGTVVLIGSENAIYARGVHLAPHEWVLAFLVILGAIELTRRTTGLGIAQLSATTFCHG